MRSAYDKFQGALRNLAVKANSPISHRGGRWTVNNRLEVWEAIGARFLDEDLDRFAETAIKVFSERDPQFELNPDERYASAIYGKILNHTPDLRRGMAEALALLGCKPQYLTSCQQGKPQHTAGYVVNSLLTQTDWRVWASLNDLLPLFAEAAPEAFLSAVEKILNNHSELFIQIFNAEGSGFGGRNYMTGLLWALETLSWSQDYFSRVIMILGEMATFDPGGRWANRPSNSLRAILLPWYPQTLASIPHRIAGVKMICRDFPEVGWSLILALLPQSQQSSTSNPKPKWREILPDDWKEGETNNEHYREQINAYSRLAIEIAKTDSTKLRAIVDRLHQLPPDSREELIEFLGRINKDKLSDVQLSGVWNSLMDFITRHRKYANAQWAWPAKEIDRLAVLAEHLEPDNPILKYQRLFIRNEFDLNEETIDFEKGIAVLDQKRNAAISEIYVASNVEGVLELARTVEAPAKVGEVFSDISSGKDELRLMSELLASDVSADIDFLGGYVWRKFRAVGYGWYRSINQENWSKKEKARLLSYLPFKSETWVLVADELLKDSNLYWEIVPGNTYDIDDGNYKTPVEHLTEVGRGAKAVDVLTTLSYRQMAIDPESIVFVLENLKPVDIRLLSPHSIIQLIQALQTAEELDQAKLNKIEWLYLSLLDGYQAHPVSLEKRLADDPAFFCEIIEAIYRPAVVYSESKDSVEPDHEESDQNRRNIATNAYSLLHNWKSVPGVNKDNKLDDGKFQAWIDSALEECEKSGRLVVAMQHIGHVLFYSPPDPDGLWLHRSVAENLNEKGADHIRKGYAVEAFNSRGVFFVDPTGGVEKGIAESYRKKSEEIELAGFHRFAATLRSIAHDFDVQAEWAVQKVET